MVKAKRIKDSVSGKGFLSFAYTYAGDKEEVAALRELAELVSWKRLAWALRQLADDLEEGVRMGAVAPGDTVYTPPLGGGPKPPNRQADRRGQGCGGPVHWATAARGGYQPPRGE